jgi:hypothetical protein
LNVLLCSLSRFVAVERGAVSYPTYPIERTRPVFSSRQQVLDYEQALALAARVDAALEVSLRADTAIICETPPRCHPLSSVACLIDSKHST